jgi:prepilin-type N-terminal cleavage/methylation domain-containing protein/prepilin-type processing-associated H-X9-DG protein
LDFRGKKMNKSRGFTLIELLVVISIIALLMAILMPTLSRAKELAAEVACIANLKQWGTAHSMFISEHNSRLPEQGFITDRSYWENEELLLCPLATKTYEEGGRNPIAAWEMPSTEAGVSKVSGGSKGSLGVNNWAGTHGGGTLQGYGDALWITADHKGSEMIPLMFDCFYIYVSPLYTDKPPAYDGEIPPIIHFGGWGHNPDAMKGASIDRHNGSINMLFLDYSIRKVGLKELWYLRWHKRWEESMREQSPPVWPRWMRNFKDY